MARGRTAGRGALTWRRTDAVLAARFPARLAAWFASREGVAGAAVWLDEASSRGADWPSSRLSAVERATPYPRAEVPRSTTETMATVATLFTPAPMTDILPDQVRAAA